MRGSERLHRLDYSGGEGVSVVECLFKAVVGYDKKSLCVELSGSVWRAIVFLRQTSPGGLNVYIPRHKSKIQLLKIHRKSLSGFSRRPRRSLSRWGTPAFRLNVQMSSVTNRLESNSTKTTTTDREELFAVPETFPSPPVRSSSHRTQLCLSNSEI